MTRFEPKKQLELSAAAHARMNICMQKKPKSNSTKTTDVWGFGLCARTCTNLVSPPPPLSLSSWISRRVRDDCAQNLPQIENEKKSHIKMMNRGDLRAQRVCRGMRPPVLPTSPPPDYLAGFQILALMDLHQIKMGKKLHIKMMRGGVLLGLVGEGESLDFPNRRRCPLGSRGWRRCRRCEQMEVHRRSMRTMEEGDQP